MCRFQFQADASKMETKVNQGKTEEIIEMSERTKNRFLIKNFEERESLKKLKPLLCRGFRNPRTNHDISEYEELKNLSQLSYIRSDFDRNRQYSIASKDVKSC
ncbi:hypothetical protein TNCT_36371 [Trichonephila clavata]|uniref:Uncharacterized protein n=1 Tax=Trichonephila clavata TaxID=2740835 RepID=A0A8X6KWX6_TRICU|nr:hypothetical protein TNCT_36371 [Trichonephila clavata]